MKPLLSPFLLSGRRSFLKQLGAACAVAVTYPAATTVTPDHPLSGGETFPVPLKRPAGVLPDEKYWEMVKKQFNIPSAMMMVNAANLCPSPYFIGDKMLTYARSLEKDVSFQNRAQFEEKRKTALDLLATFLGVSGEEIGITRNTTESNNTLVNGLDFKKGDEVLIWEQNHPTNGMAWEQRAKRFGFTVKKISVPASPQSVQQLTEPFAKAITPRTRLIAFSHISNTSGIALPAKAICELATTKGILTLIDGAQSFGSMDVNLSDIGCDFYTGSTHKWLMGPVENGILFVKKEHIEKIWPAVIGAGWKVDHQATVDEKMCMLGQRNEVSVAAIPDIIEFHQTIGKDIIQQRILQLTAYLRKQIGEKIPQATFITPGNPQLSHGIVVINIPGKQGPELFQRLYQEYGIACAPTGGLRFSPHLYNTLQDMDRIAQALTSLSA